MSAILNMLFNVPFATSEWFGIITTFNKNYAILFSKSTTATSVTIFFKGLN